MSLSVILSAPSNLLIVMQVKLNYSQDIPSTAFSGQHVTKNLKIVNIYTYMYSLNVAQHRKVFSRACK